MTDRSKEAAAEASSLWRFIAETSITKTHVRDLTDFKSSAVNFKLALWNPKVNGVRYLRTLTYNLCASLNADNWRALSCIHNRHIGRPWSVTYNCQAVCLDYLQAVLELELMERHIRFDGSTVLEIGAGYGRTCHAILSNHTVERYDIVDLPNCLELSERYLREVLPAEQFARLHFVSLEEFVTGNDRRYSLCINIDSFAEMDARVARFYLDYVSTHCDALYVKNPVAKYLDASLDSAGEGEGVRALAMNTGLLRDVIDIFDHDAVQAQAVKFIEVYAPGEAWTCEESSPALPWSHYWQALFRASPAVR